MEKLCRKCNNIKKLSEFYPDNTHSDGVHSTCKKCTNAYSKKYRDDNKEKVEEYKRILKQNNPIKYLLIQAKARCKHLGSHIPFNIIPEDVEYVTCCPVLGVELQYNSRQSKRGMVVDNAASLDRIVPELGYIKGNVRIISWRANKLKSDININEMKAMIKYYASIIESSGV